jgi:hypothetical protein
MDLHRGAYGLRLTLRTPEWLNPAPAEWVNWYVVCAPSGGAGDPPTQWLDDERAVLRLRPTGHAVIDRKAATTTLELPSSPRDEAWVHPHLATTAVVTARWQSRLALHAGSFVVDGQVWGVLGDRNAGKSSFIAWQHVAGHTPFADDLLVTDGDVAYAGPRCLDLRRGAAEHFGLGTAIGRIGTRDRWRETLPPVAPTLPLGGFIVLEWGPDPLVEPLPLGERLRRLAGSRGLLAGEEPPGAWMKALRVPMLQFTRPKDWSRIDESMALLLAAVDPPVPVAAAR